MWAHLAVLLISSDFLTSLSPAVYVIRYVLCLIKLFSLSPPLSHDLYADDTQLFFKLHEFNWGTTHLKHFWTYLCLDNINLLTLKSSKTEFLLSSQTTNCQNTQFLTQHHLLRSQLNVALLFNLAVCLIRYVLCLIKLFSLSPPPLSL